MENNAIKVVASPASRLAQALEMRHMTASELSQEINVSKSSISYYLKGKFVPKQDKLYLMGKALRVSPTWLMGLDVSIDGTANDKGTANDIEIKRKEARADLNRCVFNLKKATIDELIKEMYATADITFSQALIDFLFALYHKAYKPLTTNEKNSAFIKKYDALAPDSKILVESMVDKLLLTQQATEQQSQEKERA